LLLPLLLGIVLGDFLVDRRGEGVLLPLPPPPLLLLLFLGAALLRGVEEDCSPLFCVVVGDDLAMMVYQVFYGKLFYFGSFFILSW
jgi:hypothetical protein